MKFYIKPTWHTANLSRHVLVCQEGPSRSSNGQADTRLTNTFPARTQVFRTEMMNQRKININKNN